MNHTEYEVGLIGWLRDASYEQHQLFGLDLIARQYQEIQPKLARLLPSKEKVLLQELLANLQNGTIESLTNLASEIYLVFDADENCTDDFVFPVNLTGARKAILGLS